MATEDTYYTIDKPSTSRFSERGSRFIGYAFPVESAAAFRERLAGVKKEHGKASHHCFAYRLGPEAGDSRVHDDGEPPGSAARPILGQIDSRGLTNVLVIVVRYFGGNLLGVPGLIRAYRTTASLALEAAIKVRRPVLLNYKLRFDYSLLSEVLKWLRRYEGVILEQDLQQTCSMQIGLPKANQENFFGRMNGLNGIEIGKD